MNNCRNGSMVGKCKKSIISADYRIIFAVFAAESNYSGIKLVNINFTALISVLASTIRLQIFLPFCSILNWNCWKNANIRGKIEKSCRKIWAFKEKVVIFAVP